MTVLKNEEANFTTYFNDGFLAQIELQNNFIKSNPALQLRYYLLVTILLLIELMPIIAKTISTSGNYDEKAMQREAMEKKKVTSNISKKRN